MKAKIYVNSLGAFSGIILEDLNDILFDKSDNYLELEVDIDVKDIKTLSSDYSRHRVDQVLCTEQDISTRPKIYTETNDERRKILGKGIKTKEDKKRLKELDCRCPTAETKEDIEAMELIRSTAELLRNK